MELLSSSVRLGLGCRPAGLQACRLVRMQACQVRVRVRVRGRVRVPVVEFPRARSRKLDFEPPFGYTKCRVSSSPLEDTRLRAPPSETRDLEFHRARSRKLDFEAGPCNTTSLELTSSFIAPARGSSTSCPPSETPQIEFHRARLRKRDYECGAQQHYLTL